MLQSVSFTGSADIKITSKLKKKLSRTVESLIQRGAVNFYSGGALGWDKLYEKIVAKLGKKYPCIRLYYVLLNPEGSRCAIAFETNHKPIQGELLPDGASKE